MTIFAQDGNFRVFEAPKGAIGSPDADFAFLLLSARYSPSFCCFLCCALQALSLPVLRPAARLLPCIPAHAPRLPMWRLFWLLYCRSAGLLCSLLRLVLPPSPFRHPRTLGIAFCAPQNQLGRDTKLLDLNAVTGGSITRPRRAARALARCQASLMESQGRYPAESKRE